MKPPRKSPPGTPFPWISRIIGQHGQPVTALAFSRSPGLQDAYVASGDSVGQITLWTLQGHALVQFQAHGEAVHSLGFSRRGQTSAISVEPLLWSGGDRLRLWSLADWQRGDTLPQPLGELGETLAPLVTFALSPVGDQVATAHRDGGVCLWQDGKIQTQFQAHRSHALQSVAFSNQGDTLVTAALGEPSRFWDLAGKSLGELQGCNQGLVSLVFNGRDDRLVGQGPEGWIGFWETSGQQLFQFQSQSQGGHMACDPQHDRIALVEDDGTLYLWDFNGNELAVLPTDKPDPHTISFNHTGELLGIGFNSGHIQAWGTVGIQTIPQPPRNDLAQGPDSLQINGELAALATVLMLRNLEPPLAVGILGNWGSGKSFAMHLIQDRLNEIRCEPLRPEQAWGELASPYVGHIYQIPFDAWTYAKANLWASLMQTVFFELNRQITLEKKLEAAGVDQLKGGTIWQTLNTMSEERRRELLDSYLSAELFADPSLYASHSTWRDIDRQGAHLSSVLWDRLQTLKDRDTERLKEAESTLQEQERTLQQELQTLETEVDQELERDVRALALQPLRAEFEKLLGGAFAEIQEKLMATDPAQWVQVKAVLTELEPKFWLSLLQTWRSNRREVVFFGVAVLLAFSTPALLWWIKYWIADEVLRQFMERVVAFGANVPAFMVGFPLGQKAWAVWKQHRRQIQEMWELYQSQVIQQQERMALERQERLDRKKADRAERLRQLEQSLAQQRALVESQRQQLDLTANSASLTEFIDKRVNTPGYQEQLGLVHQVRQDIQQLTNRLVIQPDDSPEVRQQKQLLFPRGPARVVLSIDDLDRCPPERVVEVLEAVQLLLKTELFIVVLAIDDRYIARSLEQVYSGVLKRGGKPSGIDYLEKIIQLPYRLRPISPVNVRSYLRSQLGLSPTLTKASTPVSQGPTPRRSPLASAPQPPERSETIGTIGLSPTPQRSPSQGIQSPNFPDQSMAQPIRQQQQIMPPTIGIPPLESPPLPHQYLDTTTQMMELDEVEFELLVTCCKHVDITPRTAKRLINTYKILKLVWYQRQQEGILEPDLSVKQVVMAVLALSGRYPQLMRHLFEEMDSRFEACSETETTNPVLTFTLEDLQSALQGLVVSQDLEAQREWRRFLNDVQSTNGDRFSIDRDTFYLTLSFCFVGDIGYDPQDYPQRSS